MYKLYKITNRINDKSYIGITKLSLQARWAKHLKDSHNPKYPLHRAIKKYGAENFTIELLTENASRSVISKLEEPTILLHNSRNSGYNVALGGYGGDLGPEATAKRLETIKNWPDQRKADHKKKLSERNLGKTKHNDAGRKSQSEKITGNKFRLGIPHDANARAKISSALTGKPKSDLARSHMSASALKNQNGKRFAGRRATCLCCSKEWDIGNYTQHIKRKDYEFQ